MRPRRPNLGEQVALARRAGAALTRVDCSIVHAVVPVVGANRRRRGQAREAPGHWGDAVTLEADKAFCALVRVAVSLALFQRQAAGIMVLVDIGQMVLGLILDADVMVREGSAFFDTGAKGAAAVDLGESLVIRVETAR